MAASMSSVTTRGYGNGTFVGDIGLVVTLGYGFGSAIPDPPAQGETGIEFRTEAIRLHFRTESNNRLRIRTETNRLHFRPEVIR